jgi:acetolactate decarboxylase
MRPIFILYFLSLLIYSCGKGKEHNPSPSKGVQAISAMKKVMMKGDLSGKIAIDTLQKNKRLLGLGPIAKMKGEITLLKGKTYSSSFNEKDSSIVTHIDTEVSAPFFVFSYEKDLEPMEVPKKVKNIDQLEDWITEHIREDAEAFGFTVDSHIRQANVHIQNLPDSVDVKSPQDAHIGQYKTRLTDRDVTLVGFFSDDDHGIFTHHGTNMHIHLVDEKNSMTAHLEAIDMESATIHLPLDVLKAR